MMSQRLQLDYEQDLGQQQPRRTYTGRTPSDAADRRRVLTALCCANGRTSEACTLRAAMRTRSRATVEQRWNGGRMNRPVCKRVQNLWRIEVDVIDDYDCCIELRRAYLEVTRAWTPTTKYLRTGMRANCHRGADRAATAGERSATAAARAELECCRVGRFVVGDSCSYLNSSVCRVTACNKRTGGAAHCEPASACVVVAVVAQ